MPGYQSYASDSFWKCYKGLPKEIQQLADKAYDLFKENPKHPSLQFKKVGKKQPVYSARVTGFYRAWLLSRIRHPEREKSLLVLDGQS